jgi:hypothetical protein
MHKVREMFGQYLLTPNAIQALDLQKGFDNLHDRHDTASEVGGFHGNFHTTTGGFRDKYVQPLSISKTKQGQ